MPKITVNDAALYYEDSAANDKDNASSSNKPVMLFAHGLLWSTQLFDNQVEHFKNRYRCIAFDFRGQGQSEVTKSGYDMDSLADDVIGLLDALNIDKCHYLGLSMGGFVGQRVAIDHPERLHSLTLLETSADPEDPNNLPNYTKLIKAIKWLGMKRVSKKIMPILFGQSFLTDKSRKADYKTWLGNLNKNNRVGAVRATRAVIERGGIFDKLNQIKAPTLIIVGNEDVATPYVKAERIHFAIDGSKLAIIEGAGHTSTIENPEAVNETIEKFLKFINKKTS